MESAKLSVRKLAEETIRRYSKDLELLAMVAKHTTNSVIITDAEGKTIWVNQALTTLTGFTLEDMLGKKPGQLLQGKETSLESIKALREAIRTYSDIEMEIINYTKNKSMYWVSIRLTPILNSSGERIFIAVQSDITKQINYINTIKKNQEDMDALFTLSPDGVVVLDSELRISHVNEAFANLTGLESREILGLYESDLDQLLKKICKNPEHYQPINELSNVSVTDKLANNFLKNEFKFSINMPSHRTLERSWIGNNQKRISRVIYFKDVTQQAIIENMKNEFITTAAHELRTPATVILGYAELLKNKEFERDTQIEMIEAIYSKSKKVASLLDELLDVAIIEYHAEKSLKLELHSMQRFITGIADSFIFPGNSNSIILSTLPAIPNCYFDSQKIERAINNCLTNAFKFSSRTKSVEMRLELNYLTKIEVAIVISDQGIGMSPDQLSRIFEKFYRADMSGHVPGTGLGMVLVKDILEAHGGRVNVESTLGEGTTVTLYLPIIESI